MWKNNERVKKKRKTAESAAKEREKNEKIEKKKRDFKRSV
jgi:hypothetical protein